MTPEQTSLVESHFQWARKAASFFHFKHTGPVDLADLESAALEGLLEAARRFDPTKGVKFITLAYPNVYGRMRDMVREHMRLNGWTRNNGVHTQIVTRVSWPTHRDHNDTEVPFDPPGSPPDYEWGVWLGELERVLPERDAGILRGLVKGYAKKELAEELHITPGRVSQLTKRALVKLQKEIEQGSRG